MCPAAPGSKNLAAGLRTRISTGCSAVAPPGATQSLYRPLAEVAARLGPANFHTWADEEAMINAVLHHPCTVRASVASLRAVGGFAAMNVRMSRPRRSNDQATCEARVEVAALASVGSG
jgi:hypothetical protein